MYKNIDDEVELDNQYNIEQTDKKDLSMEMVAIVRPPLDKVDRYDVNNRILATFRALRLL